MLYIIKVKVLVAQSCLTLCEPLDCSPPGSSVHGILQTRILEWVAMPSSRGSSWPRDQTLISSPELAVGYLPLVTPGKRRLKKKKAEQVLWRKIE